MNKFVVSVVLFHVVWYSVSTVSLTDIHTRKPFKSTIVKEQQVISRLTIPMALIDNYNQCESPPALDKLNEFRWVVNEHNLHQRIFTCFFVGKAHIPPAHVCAMSLLSE